VEAKKAKSVKNMTGWKTSVCLLISFGSNIPPEFTVWDTGQAELLFQ